MDTSGYETVLQLKDGFLERIIDEERKRPNSPFLETFDEIPPTTVGNIDITETVVNVERGSIALGTLPNTNAIRIEFQSAEAQLTFAVPAAPSTLLYQLTADISVIGSLDSVIQDDKIQIGLSTSGVQVSATVTSGHPLADDAFLIEAITSQFQAAFSSGTFPTQDMRDGLDFVLFTADLFVEVENDVGGDPARQIRVSIPTANQIAVVFPVHLRWTNIQPSAVLPALEPSMAILAEIVITAPLIRQLAVSPAFIEAAFSTSTVAMQNIQAIEGANNLNEPGIDLIVTQTLQTLGTEIADAIGDQRFNAPTLAEINAVIIDLIQTSLTTSNQLIPFWERQQDETFQNATPKVLNGAIAIAINAGPEANLETIEFFVPDDQDFAVLVSSSRFLSEVDTFLHTPEDDNIPGTAKVNGGSQSGTLLNIMGFSDAPGIVRAGTHFTIEGLEGIYTVVDDATITSNVTTLVISPEIPPVDFTARVQGGTQTGTSLDLFDFSNFGDTIPAGTRLRIDSIEGIYTVTDDFSTLIPNRSLSISPALSSSPSDEALVEFLAAPPNDNALVQFLSTVDGGSQAGNSLMIDGLVRSSGVIRQGTRFTVEGIEGIYTVVQDAAISSNAVLLTITPELSTSPEDNARVKFIPGFGLPDRCFDSGGWDREVCIDDLHPSLRDGSFQLAGSVTLLRPHAVVFRRINADVTLRMRFQWVDNEDGSQEIEQELIGEPDIELDDGPAGVLAAILSVLITIFSGSLWAGLIAVAVVFVVKAIIEVIAGKKAGSEITKKLATTPLPDTLGAIDVDIQSRFNNPIEIFEGGILFAGTAEPTSRFASLDDSQARAGGPYFATAGMPIQLQGGLIAASTDYEWRTGDGSSLNGRTPVHVYPTQGYRVADLTTLNNQFETGVPVRSRHLGLVRILNSTPTLSPIPPIVAFEGEEIEIIANFTDPSWLDKHTAYVLFGDRTAPVIATVNETNNAPAASGTITAKHTYCDNGIFTITVKVIDEHGGSAVGEAIATIHNQPPIVDAGIDIFAYPCTPVRLVGYFEDPGWCDTHTATWNFGDCSPLFPATVIETNQPPKGTGIAIGTHCYKTCGAFVVELTVKDDDGATGSDHLFVRVVDVRNGDFEHGFYHHTLGTIANEWQPYVNATGERESVEREIFACEHCIVYNGQRSQKILRGFHQVAGIIQTIGANSGWEYQFAAVVHTAAGGGGRIRLGIDPAGGTDPNAATTIWVETAEVGSWERLAVRANATASSVSVFLEARDLLSDAAYFDGVALRVYPCPLQPQIPPPKIEEQCVNWKNIDPLPPLGIQATVEGIVFESLDGQNLRVVQYGLPHGENKLAIPEPEGLRLSWGEEVIGVEVTVSGLLVPMEMIAFDVNGIAIGSDVDNGTAGAARVLKIEAEAIKFVEIKGGQRGTLSRICIRERKKSLGDGQHIG